MTNEPAVSRFCACIRKVSPGNKQGSL
jgi:hypothetical protein